MKLLLKSPDSENLLLLALGMVALLTFFASVTALALLIREKRHRLLCLALPMPVLSYLLTQCILMHRWGQSPNEWSWQIILRFRSLPDWLVILLVLGPALGSGLLLLELYRYEKKHITIMSIKEAVDNLPSGLLCYAPGARTLLVNRVMENFCRNVTGEEVINGEAFARRLREGELLPGCGKQLFGSETLLTLPEGSSWKINEVQLPYEERPVQMLLASEITELYQKTLALQEIEKKLAEQEKRLQQVNHSIVAMTTEREILSAKVKIHDELGSNLLAIRRFILTGGTEEEKAALIASLHRSVAFLKSEQNFVRRDEYELMMDTARQLGVKIQIQGLLPQDEPIKHILATAIHECCTNTLRHARGNEVYISLEETEDILCAVFRNNGLPPERDIRESGGLASLRALAEQAGGDMTLRSLPDFALELRFKKEMRYHDD